jgi:hypothetical protein
MCSTIKQENLNKKLGHIFTVHNSATYKTCQSHWSGFIQEEKLGWWRSQSSLTAIYVNCDAFIEGKYEFTCRQLRGFILESPVILHGRVISPPGGFRIVTRAAISPFEKKIHERWPQIKWGGEAHIFTEKEIINAPRRNGQLSFL